MDVIAIVVRSSINPGRDEQSNLKTISGVRREREAVLVSLVDRFGLVLKILRSG